LQEGNEVTSRSNVTVTVPMVLDVGANVGYYSLLSAARQHAVVSFEINPSNLIRLCESIHWNQQYHLPETPLQHPSGKDINQITSLFPIRLFRNGVSNLHNETVQVVVPHHNPGEAQVKPIMEQPKHHHHEAATLYHSVATTVTLDAFAREHGWFTDATTAITSPGVALPKMDIAILKIDTEGHERYILEGAEQLLRSGMVRNVLMEYRTSCRKAVVNLLLDAGYVLIYDPPQDMSMTLTKHPTATMLTVEASRGYIDKIHRTHALADRHGNETKYEDLWFRRATNKLSSSSNINKI
jgi:hypothetical protein